MALNVNQSIYIRENGIIMYIKNNKEKQCKKVKQNSCDFRNKTFFIFKFVRNKFLSILL